MSDLKKTLSNAARMIRERTENKVGIRDFYIEITQAQYDNIVRISKDPSHPWHASACEVVSQAVPISQVPADAAVYGRPK